MQFGDFEILKKAELLEKALQELSELIDTLLTSFVGFKKSLEIQQMSMTDEEEVNFIT